MAGFSFDDIKRMWTEEKASQELRELPHDFYLSAAKHVAEINLEFRRSEQPRRELLQEELRNIARMLREIHLLRTLKAMDEITRGSFPSSLLERERQAFVEVRQILDRLQAELIAPVLSGKAAVLAPRDITNVPLVFLAEMPQIVGDDLKQYGPFKSGEVAFLPRRTAELIMKHGIARKIEVRIP
ncbi:MAG: hypothetical protein QMC89_05060 [Candidatus Hodarchaeaceae archaeon]|nr:hypothetical protein [Candidatus Hodarchaeaceae archaeon]